MNTIDTQSNPQSPTSAVRTHLRETANELVGSLFYGTLLRQARTSPLKGEYGHGGRGEEIFRAQLDEVLAERAGSASGSRLTEAIVDRFADRAEAVAAYQSAQAERLEAVSRELAALPAMGGTDE